MSHITRKPVYARCEKQKHRSDCLSAQRLWCLLPRQYNICSFSIRYFKPLASFLSWAGRSVSYLVTNPKDMFSRDVAHITCMHFVQTKISSVLQQVITDFSLP